MRTFSYLRGNVRFWLRGYVLLGVAIMIIAMALYSNHLINRMREHAETTSRQFSRYFESVLFEVTDDGRLAELRTVIRESNLPIIITVLGTEEEFENLINLDVNNPPTEKMRRLIELYREFDQDNDPIPIYVAGAAGAQGYVHYGPSPLQRELRLMPFVMLGIFLVFMAVAIQGLRFLKLSEERSIWVGLAKETAHQLGTPLSAMLGWVHLIKGTATEKGYTEIQPSIGEMEVDLGRLSKISDRFSKIGSQPDLTRVELRPLVQRTVAYFEKRMPRLKADSTISIDMPDVAVAGNEELLEWVFENLIKNALDALDDGGGTIKISARVGRTGVEVRVKDTGGGIPPTMRERVFHPGFTTKRRGWGLGLALTRRIVTEYHGGTIRLADSRRGKGATFVIRLPGAAALQ
jgi:signal transduction histidine kinase